MILKKSFFCLVVVFAFCIGCTNAQNEKNNQVICMLTEFYSEYSKFWYPTDGIQVLDSLQNKYCSNNFRRKLQKEFHENGLNHDLLTDDWSINLESLNTLEIMAHSIESGTYIVSYVIGLVNATTTPVKHIISFKVKVINEDGNYKIDEVKGTGIDPIEIE